MNVSRIEQRVLHVLARGGRIEAERDVLQTCRKVIDVLCVTREGWVMADCDVQVFQSLRAKRLIASRLGGPYHITRKGLSAVRARPDNRA